MLWFVSHEGAKAQRAWALILNSGFACALFVFSRKDAETRRLIRNPVQIHFDFGDQSGILCNNMRLGSAR